MECISLATIVLLATLATLIEFGISLPPEDGVFLNYTGRRYINAENGMFPWTVAICYKSRFLCTASIISENAILTAAECVVLDGELQDPQSFYARAGDVNLNSPNVEYINFVNITVHPNYNPNLESDLAIMKTLEPIPFSANIQPICIASPDIERLDNKEVVSMGWGERSRRIISPVHEILRYIPQRVLPSSKCAGQRFGFESDSIICTDSGTEACQGDSGASFVYFKKGKPIQVGVAFFYGVGGCSRGAILSKDEFTPLSLYTKFITENAGGSVCLEK